MKRREPKKPARKKREQETSTTGSRSRVRIRPPPPPPPPLLMAPPPFIPARGARLWLSTGDGLVRCGEAGDVGPRGEEKVFSLGVVEMDAEINVERGGRSNERASVRASVSTAPRSGIL